MADSNPKPWKRVARLIAFSLACYAALVGFMTLNQRQMLYFPVTHPPEQAESLASGTGLAVWRGQENPEGGYVGYLSRAPGSVGAALLLHGNGGCAARRGFYISPIQRMGLDLFVLEYPGFGGRAGTPAQEPLVAAAEDALARILAEGAPRVWVVGESLGSGVACQLAARRPADVAGLLLVMPFNSVRAVAASIYPWFPARWLVWDAFDSEEALRRYKGPVMVLTAQGDRVVPARFGRALFASFQGSRKKLIDVPGLDHDAAGLAAKTRVWDEAARFFGLAGAGAAPGSGAGQGLKSEPEPVASRP